MSAVDHDQEDTPRLRLEPARRFATSLVSASGMAPSRAAALASHLLWFDAAGYARFGVATLPEWLDRLGRGEVAPNADGKVGPERAATAVLDGQNGPGPLILARAAGIASEKARDVGVGLVRVRGIGAAGPAAPIVAETAVGPFLASALGPEGAWAIALPSAEGLPFVADSALDDRSTPPDGLLSIRAVIEPGEWLIQAVSVAALEPLSTTLQRVASWAASVPDSPRRLRPETWESRRRMTRERGILIEAKTVSALTEWAKRLGVETGFSLEEDRGPKTKGRGPRTKSQGIGAE